MGDIEWINHWDEGKERLASVVYDCGIRGVFEALTPTQAERRRVRLQVKASEQNDMQHQAAMMRWWNRPLVDRVLDKLRGTRPPSRSTCHVLPVDVTG